MSRDLMEGLLGKIEGQLKMEANRLFQRYRPNTLTADDLYNSGWLGCIEAAKRYDKERSRGRDLKTFCLYYARYRMIDELRRAQVVRIRQNCSDAGATEAHVLYTEDGSGEPYGGCENSRIDSVDPEGFAARLELVELIQEAMARLVPREKMVIKLRYKDELTLKQIGAMFDLSPERVRQIENRAKEKIRGFLHKKGIELSLII